MEKLFLENNWVLTGDKIGTVSATVPGCVHTDLIKEGIIKDLFWRDNNKQYEWIENEDFTYSCTFDAKESDDAVLVFEGLDTYCDIYLNGCAIGSADNMFISHEFNIGGKLQERDNVLEIRFRSPIKEVADRPALNGAFTTERLHTRRMQCTYGWDWVDRFVTCGVYRPVYIRYGSDMYVDSVYVVTENIDEFSAQICVEMEFANFKEGGLVNVAVVSPDGDVVNSAEFYCKEPKAVRRFDITEPQLWYPLGYGEHPIYTLVCTVNDNVHTETFGIRTLKVLQIPDKEGSDYYNLAKALQEGEIGQIMDKNTTYSGFQLVINGKKILCCGANWVPCEPFPSAETPEKFDKLIDLACKMKLNMLRVWGGGLFENKYFYDCCDRAGILVTQDFLMACGTYPETEEWFIESQRKEAEFAVKYLRNHPSLAWWSGDNENATEASEDMEEYRGRKATIGAIAPAIYKYDRSRMFLPSSPYGGKTYASLTSGTTHNTNYIDRMFDYFYDTDCVDYKEYLGQFSARFIAEEPVFGAVSRKSALRFMEESDILDGEQTILRHHTKNNAWLAHEVFDYITTFALKVLGAPSDLEDRYFKYKYIQFEWFRIVFENMRRNIGFCNGLVFWMFNDCWPASLGWSILDYYCMPKAAYYQFRRCAQTLVSSVTCDGKNYNVTLSNSGFKTVVAKGCAYRFDKTNMAEAAEKYEFDITADAYSAGTVKLPWSLDENNVIVCDVVCDEFADRSFYKHGDLSIHNCNDALRVVARDEHSITVCSDSYIHTVELEGDCVFSADYFSLLPGESKTVTWECLNDNSDSDFTVTAYTI